MGLSWLLNTAWMTTCFCEARAFHTATRSVAQAQTDVLTAILRRNRDTQFGFAHHFCSVDGPRAYRQQVPLSRYKDYAEAVAQIAKGKCGVLTRDRVELLEPTSGTTSGEKLIPYTAALRHQFQRAVAAWIVDLFQHRPLLREGRAYWSISPALGPPRKTSGGIPIGFEDDADYLGSVERWLIKKLLVVPAEVARLTDIESFRYCTLWHLLRADDLALMSLWSPTFLLTLLASIETWHDRLCFDLERGRLEPPSPLLHALVKQFGHDRPRDRVRARELRAIFRDGAPLSEKLRRIWPRLGLISCWGDAGAAHFLPELRSLFPDVEIQPKGLLATEGCVSIPFLGRSGAALAVRSHFFEFQELDSPENIHLAHELDRGGLYRVVLTTAGGLYRYELRDEVEVSGFENQCPLVRFLGKSDCTADLVGEKLGEPHVRAILSRLFDEKGPVPAFALLVPVLEQPPRYRLYLQIPELIADTPAMKDWTAGLEAGLCENPHYAYARHLGQLAPAEIAVLDSQGTPGWEVYERECFARGIRVGNIKPMALDPWTGWPAAFRAASQPFR
jgi:hypothetical protein